MTTTGFHHVENRTPNYRGTQSPAPGSAGSTCDRCRQETLNALKRVPWKA